MTFALETERLTLRLREPGDAPMVVQILGEHPGGTTARVEDIERRLEQQAATALETGFGLLTIRRRVEGDPIGYCGLIIGRGSFDEPEIAYEILEAHQGRGYATEAAGAVVDAAFGTGRRRLWSSVGDWNLASLRVLEKNGFRHDHTVTGDDGQIVFMVRDA